MTTDVLTQEKLAADVIPMPETEANPPIEEPGKTEESPAPAAAVDNVTPLVIAFADSMLAHVATLIGQTKKEDKAAAKDELTKFFGSVKGLTSKAAPERLTALYTDMGLVKTSGTDSDKLNSIRQTIADIESGVNVTYDMFGTDFKTNIVKSMRAELAKLEKAEVSNLAEIQAYFAQPKKGNRVAEPTGEHAMWRPTLAEIQAQDWLIKTGEHVCVLMHSSTVATAVLDAARPKIKPSATTWIIADMGGDYQFTEEKRDGKRIASPQPGCAELKPKSVRAFEFELDSLSGFERIATIAIKRLGESEAKKVSVNGWQANRMLAKQAKIVSRVKREG